MFSLTTQSSDLFRYDIWKCPNHFLLTHKRDKNFSEWSRDHLTFITVQIPTKLKLFPDLHFHIFIRCFSFFIQYLVFYIIWNVTKYVHERFQNQITPLLIQVMSSVFKGPKYDDIRPYNKRSKNAKKHKNTKNIARGTTDPGYCHFNFSYLSS